MFSCQGKSIFTPRLTDYKCMGPLHDFCEIYGNLFEKYIFASES